MVGLTFTNAERRELVRVYGVVAFLHVLGVGSFLHYAASYPSLVGLGLAAYMFGLRHAFDADHIAAVDDTVRYLVQKGRSPLGTGFFFSLGHSTIVLLLSIAIVFAAAVIKRDLPGLRNLGGVIGAGVSGTFLWVIGALNLLVLLNILDVWRKAGAGQHTHAHLDELLAQRGFINRLFGGWLRNVINHSWQMYPLGLLFGLGFDTASEVGLLGMTAGASAGNLPVAAAVSLPILFAAGMSLLDTTDGVLMAKAYNWAFINPLRKIFYNLATTALSVAVALLIGTVELLQVLIGLLGLKGPVFEFLGGLDFGAMGYAVVGLFVLAWGMSLAYWKFAAASPACRGRALSLTVVAQGVETRDQVDFLRQRACNELQGFLFTKPVPAEQVTRLIQSQSSAIPLTEVRAAPGTNA
jgi:high-affinity nickel-transport protein